MNKTLKKIFISIGIILGIGVVGTLIFIGVISYQITSGCGMDDGPFEAIKINPIEYSKNHKKFKLEDGILILDNRNYDQSPIISYIENNKTIWTLDTDVKNTPGYETCEINAINDLKVSESWEEINLSFYASWTYGGERGSMEIDKSDGDNSFCLSW